MISGVISIFSNSGGSERINLILLRFMLNFFLYLPNHTQIVFDKVRFIEL